MPLTGRAELSSELKSQSARYHLFAEVMLNGGDTDEGTFVASKNEKLRKVIEDAIKVHTDEFMPVAKNLIETKEDYEDSLDKVAQAMQSFDSQGDEVSNIANQAEALILNDIQRKKDGGSMQYAASSGQKMAASNAVAAPVRTVASKPAAIHKAKEVGPDQLIPMDDDFEDF